MHSCLYEGQVAHTRHRPVKHRFRYRLLMLYVDLAELEELASHGYFARNTRWAGAALCAGDYAAAAAHAPSIDSALRQIVQQQTGFCPAGPIRLLCQPRYFGYFFSPLNLYFCFDAAGRSVETVVAEVNNIPWRERQWYVLPASNTLQAGIRAEHPKTLHVSPFMPMDQSYRWRISPPGEHLTIRLENRDAETDLGSRLFHATLSLHRRELTPGWLWGALLRHGWISASVVAAIYWQALRLWWKRCPYYPHSQSSSSDPATKPCQV